jgi:hypothetical protein
MIEHIATQLAYAATGFAALFVVSTAVVHWRGRNTRHHRAYWNGTT